MEWLVFLASGYIGLRLLDVDPLRPKLTKSRWAKKKRDYEENFEAKLKTKWASMPPNTQLSTFVTNLIPASEGMIEEAGNLPNEPIREIGDTLTIDGRHFTVLDIRLFDGREYGSIKDVREVYVIEDGYEVPDWWIQENKDGK